MAARALSEQLPDRALTKGGTSFNPNDDFWRWTEDVFRVSLDFSSLRVSPVLRQSLKHTLVAFARTSSPSHLNNVFRAFKHFVVLRENEPVLAAVTALEVSNYAARLGPKDNGRLGTLNGLLQKWSALGLEGVEPAAAAFLEERRKPGNTKGEAVRTRNPVSGPFSEAEYTALYKAVDAAYGSGQLPRWAVVLTRLLFACGGRISQYASLKTSDFDNAGGTYVLRLPQVKQRETSSREQLKEFELSPQTGRLLQEHVADLRSQGFDDSDALFPERYLDASGQGHTRNTSDPFAGHSTAARLSKLLTKVLRPIAPPAERLDFAPMPINPQRFRYTFGTRLAEEGASLAVVADRLGHTDLQNAGHYFEASPKIVENIDRAMDAQLAPLAAAFRGRLIESEAQSTHKGAPGSRIIDFRASVQPLASCAGGGQGCAFNKPIACYTCFKFEPWLDAPHEKVLARLEAERERHAADERIAKVNDDAILAVRQVIAECAQVHEQRRGGPGR